MDRLRQWLEAEKTGRADEAEAAFSALFAGHLPVLPPPAGFAERVAAEAFRARAASPWARRSLRLLAGVAAAAMGLVLWAALAVDPFAVLQAAAARGAALAAGALTWFHASLAATLTAWGLGAALGRAVLVAAGSGPASLVLAANLLLALAASYGLSRLMASREECP